MATERISQLTFKFHSKMKTVARFDQAHASTDRGVVLLKAVDEHLCQRPPEIPPGAIT